MAKNPPAGWYPDPNDPDLARYWNGKAWTEYTGPRDSTAVPRPAPPQEGTQVAEGTPVPVPVPPPGGGPAPIQIEPPKRIGGFAWWAYAVLGLAIVANLIQIPIALDYADKVQTQIDHSSLTLQEAQDAEDAFAGAGIIYAISLLAGAIGFLVWFWRAYTNIPGITGQQLRFGKGWSIGAWFIPIFNLWRPKQIGNDIWRGGDANARGNAQWTSLPVSSLVHWWWALYLLASLLDGVAGSLLNVDPVLSNSVSGFDPPTTSELEREHAAAVVYAASSAIEVIAAVTAIVFVKRASERQDERIAQTSQSEAAA